MKAKLHKMVSGYILSLNGDIDDPYAIVNEELAKDHEWYKLSLKNCQAIENGYDLDELADEYYKQFDNLPVVRYNAYTAGFQKALEILGDKKFSEDDMKNTMDRVWDWCEDNKDKDCSSMTELRNKHIQSIQQNEWDIEIVMECCGKVYSQHCDGTCEHVKPLLDANGCLILKRI